MVAMPCSHLSSSIKSWKRVFSQCKGRCHQTFGELQAMETLKKKVSDVENSEANFLTILVDSFHSYGYDSSPFAYSFVIKYLTHRHWFLELPLILDHLENAEKFEVPERIFIRLIQDYGKADLLQDAVTLFYRIPKFRCTPSVLSLNSLLFILCKKQEGLHLVRDVLMKTPEMNIRLEASTFRILIRALCRNGKVDSAVELLNMMQLDDCSPDPRMYSLVLSSLCKQAGGSKVMDFLEEMRNAGVLPTTSEYNGVIDVLVQEGRASDALSVLTQMKLDGKRPDITSYNIVLKGCFLENDFLKVDELFDEILLTGLVPNSFTYNTYIEGLCEQGEFERASRMVICMDKVGCKPNTTTFNVLIAGYSKAGEMGKAREVTNEMVHKGVHWNSQTYDIMINGFITKGEMVGACDLLMEMLVKGYFPSTSNFGSLVSNLCKNGCLCEDVRLLEEVVS